MKKTSQIKNLITKFGIQEEIENSFKNILENHTCEELDLVNKNISINSKNIEHSKNEFGYNKFQTPIINVVNIQIGNFALVVTNENERIDEYFVINK